MIQNKKKTFLIIILYVDYSELYEEGGKRAIYINFQKIYNVNFSFNFGKLITVTDFILFTNFVFINKFTLRYNSLKKNYCMSIIDVTRIIRIRVKMR